VDKDKDKDKIHPFTGGGYARMPDAADDAALPGEDDPYRAAGTPENGEIPALVAIMGREGFQPGGTPYYDFEYVHISNLEFGITHAGQMFRFVYSGFQPKLVIVYGDALLRMWHYIGKHRMPWIRQADRDLRPAGAGKSKEPVITKIEVYDWTRPKPQAEELAKAREAFEEA
jgi:hypothetical protein